MEQDKLYGDPMGPYTESTIDLKYLQYRRGMSVNVTDHEYCVYTLSDITGLSVEGGKSVMHFFLRKNNKGSFSPYINENDECWVKLRNDRCFPVYRTCNTPPLETAVDGCCVFCFVYGKDRFRNVPVLVKQLVYRDKRTLKIDQSFSFGVCKHCNDPRNFEFLDVIVGQHMNHCVFSYYVYDVDTKAKPRDYSSGSKIGYTSLASLEDEDDTAQRAKRARTDASSSSSASSVYSESRDLDERNASLSRRVGELEAFVSNVSTLMEGYEDRMHEVKASLRRFIGSYCRAAVSNEMLEKSNEVALQVLGDRSRIVSQCSDIVSQLRVIGDQLEHITRVSAGPGAAVGEPPVVS